MAEIKSTMEKVMERAATMGKASQAELDVEKSTREGMKLAADFLAHREEDLTGRLEAAPEVERAPMRSGVVQALLRNIVLPRDEDTATAERAMQGLGVLGKDASDLRATFQEMRQILSHYAQHRKQLRQQLQDAIRQQLEQALAQTGQAVPGGAALDPTLHPKYQEEWQRLEGDLMEQYGNVLYQHKKIVGQRFGL
jgi:hypothetical protein